MSLKKGPDYRFLRWGEITEEIVSKVHYLNSHSSSKCMIEYLPDSLPGCKCSARYATGAESSSILNNLR